MSSRNIKMALNSSYQEMPNEISVVFERLSRELASSYDYESHLKKFAKSLGYVWGYAFTPNGGKTFTSDSNVKKVTLTTGNWANVNGVDLLAALK